MKNELRVNLIKKKSVFMSEAKVVRSQLLETKKLVKKKSKLFVCSNREQKETMS